MEVDLDRQTKASTTYLLFELLDQRMDHESLVPESQPMEGRLSVHPQLVGCRKEPRLPALGYPELQHLC